MWSLQLLGIKKGILILDVPPDSAAQQAGLRGTARGNPGSNGYFGGGVGGSSNSYAPQRFDSIVLGDIIVAMDKDVIGSEADLFRAIEKHKVGDVVGIKVLRAVTQDRADHLSADKVGSTKIDETESDGDELNLSDKVSFQEVTVQLKLSSPKLEAI